MKQVVLLATLLVSASAFANDVDPFNFERQHFATSSMTRAEMRAQASAPAGGIDIDNDGRVVTPPSLKTRAQVAAETAEASRLGLLSWGGHDAKIGTVGQEQEIRMAGEHASKHSAASD